MNRKILFISISIYVSSCGGGGSSNNSSDQAPNNPVQISEKTKGQIELGPVKGASVAIQTIDGYTLLNTVTDETGNFEVDIDALKSAVDDLGENIEFVKIISTGGIDTDPDDDGDLTNTPQLEVKGNVSGIVPLSTIYESNDYRVNFISTALVEIINDSENLTLERINYIALRLGISDINQDGKIDINDIIQYKMNEDESVVENTLREGFLEFIHNGNNDSRKLFVDNLVYDTGFIEPNISNQNSRYSITLSGLSDNSDIFYGIATNQNPASYLRYTQDQVLNLQPNQALFYQECSEIYGCDKLQKLFFYQNKFYIDHDYEPSVDVSNIGTILGNLDQKRKELQKLEQEEIEANTELQVISKEVLELEAKVNSI